MFSFFKGPFPQFAVSVASQECNFVCFQCFDVVENLMFSWKK